MTDSRALLSEYVETGSEPAFRELVGPSSAHFHSLPFAFLAAASPADAKIHIGLLRYAGPLPFLGASGR